MPGREDGGEALKTLGAEPREQGGSTIVRVVVAFSPDPGIVGSMRLLGDEAIVVGRTGCPGLALPDPRISRTHAALELHGAGARIRDLGSRNGVYVNGQRVSEAVLRDHDVVRIGDHCLVVQVLGEADVRLALDAPPRIETLVGDGRAMRALRAEIVRAAAGTVAVLLLGETGTGKELVAAAIHALSGRRGEFVPVNCAAIPEQLAEGELFGYVRGAFTGATGDSGGLFRAADGGTLLLDEIGEMPLALQAKLLRALATGEVRRVGETSAKRVDVRVVAATHVDLLEAAQDQRFRPDLLARLAGHVIRVPPLRERREDVLALASYFLAKAGEQRIERNTHERVARSFGPDAAEALLVHDWPFNVRGLEQTVRVAAAHAPEGRVDLAHLGPGFRSSLDPGRTSPVPSATSSASRARVLEVRPDAVPTAEELRAVIEHFEGRIGRIAAFFGKERRQIYRWAERYEIDLASARDE